MQSGPKHMLVEKYPESESMYSVSTILASYGSSSSRA